MKKKKKYTLPKITVKKLKKALFFTDLKNYKKVFWKSETFLLGACSRYTPSCLVCYC